MAEEICATTKEKTRPLLKWVGGKTRLLPELRARLPIGWSERTYVEPFCGSAALFFDLKPKKAILSDTNRFLIRTLQAVQNQPDELCDTLAHFEKEHCKEFYYETREFFNKDLGTSFDAATFIYLNRTCFNGLWRTNKDGKFNVPMGAYDNPKMPSKETVMAASDALQVATLVCWDFVQICNELPVNECFIYFDPPYDPISSTSSFTSYTPEGFNARMQIKLRDVFNSSAARGNKAMLSNSDTEFVRELYKDFRTDTVSVRRSISAGVRGNVTEVIIINY